MRAILIDPVAKKVTEVEYKGPYTNIYKFLSDEANGLKVDTFTVVNIDDVNSIYVDDEGLLNDPRYFFKLKDYPQPLSGRGLVLGVDEEGETIGTTLNVADIEKMIAGYPELSVKGFESYEGKIDHPVMGKDTPVIGSYPVFGPAEPKEDV